MKPGTKDHLLSKKPQYSSKILVTPTSTQNKNVPKLTYSRRGVSTDPYRESGMIASADSESLSVNSLITQSPKDGNRPLTSNNYGHYSPKSAVKYDIYPIIKLVPLDLIPKEWDIPYHRLE
jgi:hypothetical protein